MTETKAPRTVAYPRLAPTGGGSVKIGSLGQKRIGANKKPYRDIAISLLTLVFEGNNTRPASCVGSTFASG